MSVGLWPSVVCAGLGVTMFDKIKGFCQTVFDLARALVCRPIELLFDSQTRVSWRRVATMAMATGFLPFGYIDGEQWVFVACIYIGGDTLEKAMRGLRG